MVRSIIKEITLRSIETNEPIKTIYLGGGTPSAIGIEHLQNIINAFHNNFNTSEVEEFTIEVNPDDMSEKYLSELKNIGVTRLSIGVQSFFEQHLKWMNRSHDATQATQCIESALKMDYKSSSVDLIYGYEQLSTKEWEINTNMVLNSGLNHISCYTLTIEEKTPFAKMQASKNIKLVNEGRAWEQFKYINEKAIESGWDHYEISNFAKNKNYSIHNQSYWQAKPYIGIGPGAHSFDGKNQRSWNVSDNWKYIDHINTAKKYSSEFEVLSPIEILNEKIMVGLRTKKGIPLEYIKNQLADNNHPIHGYIKTEHVIICDKNCRLSVKGWWISDAIIASLFQDV